jgi:hypothetical protein
MFKMNPLKSQRMAGDVTPQGKIIHVANRFGNPAIASMQGTSRIIYDSLPLDGRTEYRFFEGAGSRVFPFTNLDSNSGKLNVGESLAIQYAQLIFFVRDAVTGSITATQPLNTQPNFEMGELSFVNGEQQVLKRVALCNFSDEYNKDANIPGYNNYRFETYLTIQSLLEFTAIVRPAIGVTTANTFVRLVLEGTGSLFSPKSNQ